MKKKLLAVVMTVVMTCMMLTGCAKLAPADQTVSALFDLYVKDDASAMQSLLGFSSEEAVKAAFMEDSANTDMVEGLKAALEDDFDIAKFKFESREMKEIHLTHSTGEVIITVATKDNVKKDKVEFYMVVEKYINEVNSDYSTDIFQFVL